MSRDQTERSKWSRKQAQSLILGIFLIIIMIIRCSGMFRDVPGCSGMFRDVPGCSGMFRDVPGCSGMFRDVPDFIDGRSLELESWKLQELLCGWMIKAQELLCGWMIKAQELLCGWMIKAQELLCGWMIKAQELLCGRMFERKNFFAVLCSSLKRRPRQGMCKWKRKVKRKAQSSFSQKYNGATTRKPFYWPIYKRVVLAYLVSYVHVWLKRSTPVLQLAGILYLAKPRSWKYWNLLCSCDANGLPISWR